MVTLRIWLPSRAVGQAIGYCSVAVSSPWGDAYASVRAVQPDVRFPRRVTANFGDDVKATGADTRHRWMFRRLDESRVLRMWDQFKGDIASQWDEKPAAHNDHCFHICHRLLLAGQGFDTDDASPASFTQRAKNEQLLAMLAKSHNALASYADAYAKVEHW